LRGSPVLKSIREVICLEAKTLRRVAEAVDEAYARAVGLLSACRGKVVVTGIGKSGLIAQKVAATLNSTGTPAAYMHPADALHGDIGLIERRDIVLAIGKSGESVELNALLPALRRLGVKILSITAAPDSALARGSDAVLLTPVEREACPLNLAPTCSTTAALAVGDALAIALMRRRGFDRERFALLHPGGQLGRRLTLRVEDVMRKGPDNPVIAEDAGVPAMLVEITRKRAGAASAVDRRGRMAGLVTDFDIRRALEKGEDLSSVRVRDIMNPRPTFIRSGSLASEAVELMTDGRRPLNVLPVLDARGRPVGMVQIHDLRAKGL
jgi:arabinose-5-phosphate isomerase